MIRLLFSNLSPRIFSYLVAAVLCFGVGRPAWAQFETRATNPFPQGAFSTATGDFNNDGRLDVVMKTDKWVFGGARQWGRDFPEGVYLYDSIGLFTGGRRF